MHSHGDRNNPDRPLGSDVKALADAGAVLREQFNRERERADKLAGEAADLRGRAGRAEGEAAALRDALERERLRADQSEAAARQARQAEAEAIEQATGLESEVETLRTALAAAEDDLEAAEQDRTRLRAERDAAQAELADWTAGGPVERAWRALLHRRVSNLARLLNR
jgi:chromosome segregation ATPase